MDSAEVILLRRKEPNSQPGYSQYRIAYGGVSKSQLKEFFERFPAYAAWLSLMGYRWGWYNVFVEGSEELGCVYVANDWDTLLEKYEYVEHLHKAEDVILP